MSRSSLLSLVWVGSLVGSSICTPLMLPHHAHASQLNDEPSADPSLAEAQSLYKEGEIKFQTGEYTVALDLWKRAYAILPDGDGTRAIRHALVYNIAEAHSRAYEVSRNPTHLRTAKVMLETYRSDHRALYGDEPEAVKERTEVEDRLAELDKKIEASVAANEQALPLTTSEDPAPPPEPAPTPEQPIPQPTAKPLTPQKQWEAELKADPVLGPQWDKSNKKIVGGAILSGIGIPFAGASIAIFITAARAQAAANTVVDDPFAEDVTNFGTGLLWASGGVTAVIAIGLMVPGGVLLGTGIGGRQRVLKAKPKPTAMLLPTFGPHGGGLSYTLRF